MLETKKKNNESKEIIKIIAENTNMEIWKDTNKMITTKIEELNSFDEYFATKDKEMRSKSKKDQNFSHEANSFWNRAAPISPVEISVICNRIDWLKEALIDWKLSGNVFINNIPSSYRKQPQMLNNFITNRHILNYALNNCSEEIIETLLTSGNISQFISLVPHFNLDKAFIDALQSLSYGLRYLNASSKVAKEDIEMLLKYNEYVMKSTKSVSKSKSKIKDSENSYMYEIIKMASTIKNSENIKKSKEDNKEYTKLKEREKILLNALSIYLKNFKEVPTNEETLKEVKEYRKRLVLILIEFQRFNDKIITIM